MKKRSIINCASFYEVIISLQMTVSKKISEQYIVNSELFFSC